MQEISIHAPREGSDIQVADDASYTAISIHAPREGSDQRITGGRFLPQHFYPRSPRGERPAAWTSRSTCCIFLSTLPARGATLRAGRELAGVLFLSTLPARGATGSEPKPKQS